MTAEIIQFGKATAAVPRQSKPARRRHAPSTKEIFRFMFNDQLYEVEFGGHVQRVFSIQYRISRDGVQEMRRHPGRHSSKSDEIVQVINAARRIRAQGNSKIDEIPFREAAVAQLRKRQAKLVRELEQVEATIASMQREVN
jgi:hypothetical protein